MGELDLDKIERHLTQDPRTEDNKPTWYLEEEQNTVENILPRQKVPVLCYDISQ